MASSELFEEWSARRVDVRRGDGPAPAGCQRPVNVLLVEDDADDAWIVERMMRADREEFTLSQVATLREARDRLGAESFDIVLLDLSLPDSSGLDTCTALRRAAERVPIVVLSGVNDESVAIDAVKSGAQDYLVKGRVDADLLRRSIRYAIERRHADERHVTAETLRALRELASGVAHHLNNVLQVVTGQVELLLARSELTRPELVDGLSVVARAANYGAEVVRRLQTFTTTRAVVGSTALDLNELALDVLELSRPLWQDGPRARGVLIEARLEAGEIPDITGEPLPLRQALMSLLVNAVDALPAGGHIIMRTWATPDAVYCAVADDGVGMSDEVRLRALEPFFTTKGPSSTGLGLSIAHGIVEQHGGEMSIESVRLRGTTVTIRLPVTPGPSSSYSVK